jgi:hypothetical protein
VACVLAASTFSEKMHAAELIGFPLARSGVQRFWDTVLFVLSADFL